MTTTPQPVRHASSKPVYRASDLPIYGTLTPGIDTEVELSPHTLRPQRVMVKTDLPGDIFGVRVPETAEEQMRVGLNLRVRADALVQAARTVESIDLEAAATWAERQLDERAIEEAKASGLPRFRVCRRTAEDGLDWAVPYAVVDTYGPKAGAFTCGGLEEARRYADGYNSGDFIWTGGTGEAAKFQEVAPEPEPEPKPELPTEPGSVIRNVLTMSGNTAEVAMLDGEGQWWGRYATSTGAELGRRYATVDSIISWEPLEGDE